MIHILIVSISLAAAVPPSLFEQVLHAPPRPPVHKGSEREVLHFCEALKKFLHHRAMTSPDSDVSALLARLVEHARTSSELGSLFRVLGDPDSGLEASEVAALMMNEAFLEHGDPVRAASAFQHLVGSRSPLDGDSDLFESKLPLEAGYVSKRQMQIFAELAKYTRDFLDWKELAAMPGNHSDVRTWVSDAMVIGQLDKLRSWNLNVGEWKEIFSYYDPDCHDSVEKEGLVSHFSDYTRLLSAIERVSNWRTRADLQEAMLRRVCLPSKGVVRTILSPLGEDTPLVYQAYLDKLKARYIDGARHTDCEKLVVAWSADRPMKSTTRKRATALPEGFRVIDNTN